MICKATLVVNCTGALLRTLNYFLELVKKCVHDIDGVLWFKGEIKFKRPKVETDVSCFLILKRL